MRNYWSRLISMAILLDVYFFNYRIRSYKLAKKIFIICFCIFSNSAYSQSVAYDSLLNISKKNYKNLIGEVLIQPKSNFIWPNLFWTNMKGKIYHKFKSHDGKYCSESQYVQDKEFLIKEIVQSKEGVELIKCICLENNDIVYINSYFLENTFPPFYVKGYYEKMKRMYEGISWSLRIDSLDKKRKHSLDKYVEDNGKIVNVDCDEVGYVSTKYGVCLYINFVSKNGKDNYEHAIIDGYLDLFVSPDEAAQIRDKYKNRIYETKEAKKYIGKRVYYGLASKYKYNKEDERYSTCRNNRILVDNSIYILTKGYYDCVDFCYDEKNEAYAILKDRYDILFKVPVYKEKVPYDKVYYEGYNDFSKYFLLEEETNTMIMNMAKEKKERDDLYNKLLKKYGKDYAERFADYPATAERFEKLANKYGKANAKLMVSYGLRIGWTSEMVRISWGSPHRINSTTGTYGTHEQWVYKDSDSEYSYLYFENDILTTIQE